MNSRQLLTLLSGGSEIENVPWKVSLPQTLPLEGPDRGGVQQTCSSHCPTKMSDDFEYTVTPPSLNRGAGSRQLVTDDLSNLTQQQLIDIWSQNQIKTEEMSTTPTSATTAFPSSHNAYVAAALAAQQNQPMDLLEPADPSWTMPGNVAYITHDLSSILGNYSSQTSSQYSNQGSGGLQRNGSLSSHHGDGRETPTEEDSKPSARGQTFVHKLHKYVVLYSINCLLVWLMTDSIKI